VVQLRAETAGTGLLIHTLHFNLWLFTYADLLDLSYPLSVLTCHPFVTCSLVFVPVASMKRAASDFGEALASYCKAHSTPTGPTAHIPLADLYDVILHTVMVFRKEHIPIAVYNSPPMPKMIVSDGISDIF
jgi:hypothetical protein